MQVKKEIFFLSTLSVDIFVENFFILEKKLDFMRQYGLSSKNDATIRSNKINGL